MRSMSIDKTKCCGAHTQEKEESGECCQVKDEEQIKEQNE